ncbi:hypothetical protein chiPu_0022408 [Chiloscyllium punctatum]|uniref:Uncharacterized protein n=1 Tax=Chiloscyllium punctatum TaxID=137246 RepID=A0A401RDU5_CHIPU|nr:hypothetical protein [Chiloscyllium punctatum]
MLLHAVVISPHTQLDAMSQSALYRTKRRYVPDPTIRIDSIGQPRGIPNEFKARNEIAVGWEALIPTIEVSKNAEWINYIYYNQQRFLSYTDDVLVALGEQLDVTTTITWQSRQALDWILAEKGGVCVIFGEHCCAFILNNTSPGGSFTKAMERLTNLKQEVKDNAEFGHQAFDWLNTILGFWGAWFVTIGLIVGAVLLVVAFVFCCALPFIQSFLVRVTTRKLVVISATPGSAYSSDGTPPLYHYGLTTATVQGICP